MKHFNAPKEVQDRLEALISELHDLCANNGIPYVASCITANDETGADQVISTWVDGPAGLAPDSICAALEVLSLPFVPDELCEFIQEVSDDLNDGAECDCEACQLARGAAACLH